MTNQEDFLKKLNLRQLVEAFEYTDKKDGEEIPTVRGWVMDELEHRDGKAFDEWLDSNESSPRKYFIK